MKPIDCEQVRDLLPDLLGGRLEATQSARVRAHTQSCAECRAELAVATAVTRARLAVPAGLNERVAAAVQGRGSRRPRWPAALAASIAVAVIGGSAIVSSLLRQPALADAGAAADVQGAGFISVDDALLTGASSLRELSVQELEQLLAEIER